MQTEPPGRTAVAAWAMASPAAAGASTWTRAGSTAASYIAGGGPPRIPPATIDARSPPAAVWRIPTAGAAVRGSSRTGLARAAGEMGENLEQRSR
jgi:hypothetical protein